MYGHLVLLFPLLCSTAAALQMTGPSTYTASVGSIAHIPCTFTADKLPADLKFFAVVWYLEEKRILRYDNTVTSTHPRYSLEEDRALNGNAALTISNTSVSDGGDYTCSVIYSPLQMEKKIRVDITAIPTITMVNKVVTVSTKSSLNSTISGFYPARIDIKWLRDGVILYNVAVEELQRDPDGTYSVNSSVTITPTEEDRERIFSCRIQHESLTAPLQEDFRLVYSAQPLVSILGNSVQRNVENTLTCMVSGFFPSDIVVTWYKDGKVLKDPLMGKPHKNDNGTFQVNSTVTIKPSDDDQNKTFSCRVQHVSLQEPLQEDFQLSYQESSSHSIIIYIVVPAVVIIAAVIIGIILWKLKCRRKGGRLSDEEAEHQDNENHNLIPHDESGDVRGTRHSIHNTNKTSIRKQQPDPREEPNHSQMTNTKPAVHRKPPDTTVSTPGGRLSDEGAEHQDNENHNLIPHDESGDVRGTPHSIHHTNKTSIRNQQPEPREEPNHSQMTNTKPVVHRKHSGTTVSSPGDVRGTQHSINDTNKTSISNQQPEPREKPNHSQMTKTKPAVPPKPSDTTVSTPGGRLSDEEAETQDNENHNLIPDDESGDARQPQDSINDTNKTSIMNPQPEPREKPNHSQMTKTKPAVPPKPSHTTIYTPGGRHSDKEAENQDNENQNVISGDESGGRLSDKEAETQDNENTQLISSDESGNTSLENQRSEHYQTMTEDEETEPSADNQEEEKYYSKGSVRNSIAMYENKNASTEMGSWSYQGKKYI